MPDLAVPHLPPHLRPSHHLTSHSTGSAGRRPAEPAGGGARGAPAGGRRRARRPLRRAVRGSAGGAHARGTAAAAEPPLGGGAGQRGAGGAPAGGPRVHRAGAAAPVCGAGLRQRLLAAAGPGGWRPADGGQPGQQPLHARPGHRQPAGPGSRPPHQLQPLRARAPARGRLPRGARASGGGPAAPRRRRRRRRAAPVAGRPGAGSVHRSLPCGGGGAAVAAREAGGLAGQAACAACGRLAKVEWLSPLLPRWGAPEHPACLVHHTCSWCCRPAAAALCWPRAPCGPPWAASCTWRCGASRCTAWRRSRCGAWAPPREQLPACGGHQPWVHFTWCAPCSGLACVCRPVHHTHRLNATPSSRHPRHRSASDVDASVLIADVLPRGETWQGVCARLDMERPGGHASSHSSGGRGSGKGLLRLLGFGRQRGGHAAEQPAAAAGALAQTAAPKAELLADYDTAALLGLAPPSAGSLSRSRSSSSLSSTSSLGSEGGEGFDWAEARQPPLWFTPQAEGHMRALLVSLSGVLQRASTHASSGQPPASGRRLWIKGGASGTTDRQPLPPSPPSLSLPACRPTPTCCGPRRACAASMASAWSPSLLASPGPCHPAG